MSADPILIPYPRSRRWAYLGLVFVTAAAGGLMMLGIVSAAGVSVLEIIILALFLPTFAWISSAFWASSIGFVLRLLRLDPLTLARRVSGPDPLPPRDRRTAIVMPIYNEDADRVIRTLARTAESVQSVGWSAAFDFFVLSDSTAPDTIYAEEAAWERLIADPPATSTFRYRRRDRNIGRKAGNIAEFMERRGDDYEFTVVLDADSVMTGDALARLVSTMCANPDVGLIQTIPIPSGQRTPFGRMLQFGSALYSPVLAAGQSFWQSDSANYWGHNAILRNGPFRDHGRLPKLPGSPPFGGEILSHDFVEAALLRRAGWKALLLSEIEGSYEEVPGNIVDYAKRDRRWAQGSLQHLRLLVEPGFHATNRAHFLMGAMGYVSSCLWLFMLLASTAYVAFPAASSAMAFPEATALTSTIAGATGWVSLLVVTAVILFLPKVFGVVLALVERRKRFGGGICLTAGALIEGVFAVLIAPVMMIYHARSVFGILAGRTVRWESRARGRDGVPWAVAVRETAAITLSGVIWTAVTIRASTTFFLWLTPILTGLLLAAPLVRWTSSHNWGRWTRRLGLFLVPTELDEDSGSFAVGRPSEAPDVARDRDAPAGVAH